MKAPSLNRLLFLRGHRLGDRSVEIEVDAALFLVEAAPAAGARIFALGDHRRAGRAADRLVALSEQRMLGQAVLDLVGVDVGVGEVGQRIDLDAVVAGQLEMRQHAALLGLEALAAGDPAAKLRDHRRRAARSCGCGSRNRDRSPTGRPSDRSGRRPWGRAAARDVGQAQVLLQRLDIVERLGEVLAGLEEIDRQASDRPAPPCAAAPTESAPNDETIARSPGSRSVDGLAQHADAVHFVEHAVERQDAERAQLVRLGLDADARAQALP